jgi:feruloyl esterase
VIAYGELSTGIRKGFAAANSDLGTGSSGCNPLYCGSAGDMRNPLAIALGDTSSVIRSGSIISATGRSIVHSFYQQNTQKAYFDGCSTGGQNALMEAQRFPSDYNGILAGAAAFNRTHMHMVGLAVWQDTHATPGRSFSQVK